MNRLPFWFLAAVAFFSAPAPTVARTAPPIAVSSLPNGRWIENGIPVCAADSDQTGPDGAPDGEGGAFFVWSDGRAGPALDIFASHVTGKGDLAAGWKTDGNPVCTAPDVQSYPRVVPDGSGGALVVWIDNRDGTPALYAQHLRSDGGLAQGWPGNGLRIQGGVSGSAPVAIDADGSGGAMIAWLDQGRVFAQRITGGGAVAPGWPAGGMNISCCGYADGPPRLSADGRGGAYVLWPYTYPRCTCDFCELCTYTDYEAVLAHVRATGIDWVRTTNPIGNGPLHWDFAGDGERGAFWAWAHGVSGFYVERIGIGGNTLWQEPVLLSNSNRTVPGSDGLGGVFFCTSKYAGVNDFDIFAVRLAPDGQVAPGWSSGGTVVCSAPGPQDSTLPPLMDGTGGAYFCWSDGRGADLDVYGSRMTADGFHAPGWSPAGNPISAAAGDQVEPRMCTDSAHGAIIVWRDQRSGNADIYAQRIGSDFPVPILISLVRADAEPDVVRLSWFAEEGGVTSAVVYRRDSTSDWKPIATLYKNGTGYFEHEDRQVRGGARYGYRLGIQAGDPEQFFGETWVTVPVAHAVALESLGDNPIVGALNVSFSLASREPVALELFDFAGRRLASRDVSEMGPGRHTLMLAAPGQLSPGVYVVRLSQRGCSLTTKACVLR